MKISVIIPVYNEQKTVTRVLASIIKLKIPGWTKEIIVVDDRSTDETIHKLQKFHRDGAIDLIRHSQNLGKGRAIKSGVEQASGDYIIIQDADLEYDPADIKKLINLAEIYPNAAIFGSRFQSENEDTIFGHRSGNLFLTFITNLLYGSHLTDMETCYKLIPRKYLKSIIIESQRFNFEPEITAKLLKSNIKIIEVPISYHKRGFSEGKKLKWFNDGWSAIFTLVKYRFK